MLEEMANTVYKSNANEHIFRKLMDELQATMTIYRVWGSHLGSSQLFKQHLESRRRITEFVEKMQVEYKQDLATPSSPGLVNALPEECIREILLRLSDSRDLETASKTCETMKSVASEKRVWRELVQTHFTKMQVKSRFTNCRILSNFCRMLSNFAEFCRILSNFVKFCQILSNFAELIEGFR